MPVREINLISTKRPLTKQEEVAKRVLHLWTPIILVTFLLILSIVFGVSWYLGGLVKSTDNQITSEKRLIAAQEEDEGYYSLLKQKIGALSKIFAERYSFVPILTYFTSAKTEGIKLLTLNVSEDGTILINVTATDSFTLDSYINKLIEEASEKFNRIELVNVRNKTDGSYQISLDVISKNKML